MENHKVPKKPLVCYTLPKAEMHVHISLALANEIFLRRIKDRRTPLGPDFLLTQNSRYYKDLKEHHQTYESMRHITRTPRELASVVQDYLERISREGCIYAEISYSFRDGNRFAEQIEAIEAGIEAARYNKGIETRIIVTSIRDFGAEKAEAAARYLAKNRFKYVTGFGFVGDEGLNPFSDFSKALQIAWHEAGLGLTPHVAEQHPRNALDFLESLPTGVLDVKETDPRRLRVGHGILIHMSSALMDEFRDKNICMEMCLSANKRLGLPNETKVIVAGQEIVSTNGKRQVIMDRPRLDYYNHMKMHPIDDLAAHGIPVCLGSDNPLLMNTNIGKEYSLAVKAGYAKIADPINLTKNALNFANIDYDIRQKLLNHISQYEATIAMGKIPVKTVLGYRRAFKDLDINDM